MRDEELTAAIRQVQERARSRVPQGATALEGVAAPDLMPLVHARDAAESKVAAIGTVNPRAGGLVNSIIQSVKRKIARTLYWFVRDQIEFNRASVACVQASLEAMTEMSRSIAALSLHIQTPTEAVNQAREEVRDVRNHWAEWRVGFEERRNVSEIHLLRSVSELQAAFQHRVTLLEQNFRDLTKRQHDEFERTLAANTLDVQQRLWTDLQNIRLQYDQQIYSELRLLRQKFASAPATVVATGPLGEAPMPIDWTRFAEVFRGSEERVRQQQKVYAGRFAGAAGSVLDIGCGRGEFLEAAREAGVAARGIDANEECIAECVAKNLTAEQADLFQYLEALPDQSLGGAICTQVVEHLPPVLLPRLVTLLGKKIRTGGLVIFETPNPECLAIFATHFYIDPTHTRPVPPVLMHFYLEEAGFGGLEIERLFPAVEFMPSLGELPAAFREAFFGCLDYAITGRKL